MDAPECFDLIFTNLIWFGKLLHLFWFRVIFWAFMGISVLRAPWKGASHRLGAWSRCQREVEELEGENHEEKVKNSLIALTLLKNAHGQRRCSSVYWRMLFRLP